MRKVWAEVSRGRSGDEIEGGAAFGLGGEGDTGRSVSNPASDSAEEKLGFVIAGLRSEDGIAEPVAGRASTRAFIIDSRSSRRGETWQFKIRPVLHCTVTSEGGFRIRVVQIA